MRLTRSLSLIILLTSLFHSFSYGNELVSQAELNIEQLISSYDKTKIYRAIVAYDEIYSYLTVEEIQLPKDDGDKLKLLKSIRIKNLTIEKKDVASLYEGASFKNLVLNRNILSFTYSKNKMLYSCTLDIEKNSLLKPICN